MPSAETKITSSFRDPSGFIFKKEGIFYRQVNESYRENYDQLITSGLFKILVNSGFIINHEEIKVNELAKPAYKILKPEQIPFVSYPYEWCFSQLKDAALLTLKIQTTSLEHGLSLKDASAYNIQFVRGRPLFIDTLSFEKYDEDKPWVAYRQFCQHFLAPLALMSMVDLRLGILSQLYLDGIPLDITASLLPLKTKFSLGLAAHIHLHARSLKKHAHDFSDPKNHNLHLDKNRLMAIIQSLTNTINSLPSPSQKTEWGNYYNETNYSDLASNQKKEIINRWLSEIKPKSVWDAGGNDGTYSRLASQKDILTVCTDIDPVAIEKAYLTAKKNKDASLLPLVFDLTNPSPAIGWANDERLPFLTRTHFDLTFCLAFIHHLAISHNLPFSYVASLFQKISDYLIIEFVPKEDSNTQLLLASREDIFPEYNQSSFEKQMAKYFVIKEKIALADSRRTLYLMKTLKS